MRVNRLLLSVAVITSAGLAGCGTITDGGSQTVDVIVRGSPTATCTFQTSKFRNSAQFPNKVTLERSREDLQADCQGEQNRHTSFIVPTHVTGKGTFGNVIYGILPGTAYDAATGGLYEYPNPIIVDFRNIGEGPKPAWPADIADSQVDVTRIGTANIAPPLPVRMQPIMDDQLDPSTPNRVTATPIQKTQVIDAVRIAVDKQPAAGTSVTTTTTTTAAPTSLTGGSAQMKPIISPEDDPAVMKAKAKAKAEAAKKAQAAKDAAAAKKKAAAEAKKAAAEAEAAAKTQALPETTATPPADTNAAPSSTPQSTPAPATDADATPPATTTTTTTTTVVAPADPAANTPPAATTSSTTTTTTTAPADPNAKPADAPKSDMDKYLEGQ